MVQAASPRFFFKILMFTPFLCSAEDIDISGTLFRHVLDGSSLSIFPGFPDIPLPFGITVHFVMLLLASGIILALFVPSFRRPALKIRGVASALEAIVIFVRDDIVYPVMGEDRGEKWLPFFSTLFVFILTVNYLGLIPAFKTATGNINVTSALALMIMMLIFTVGFINLGIVGFFKNMYPEDAPVPIGVFVLLLEIMSTFIKSMVLSLRIFANMFAGHLAILSFLVLIFVLSPLFTVVALPFAVFIYTLEVLVALIQALVFTLLSCIFISMASSSH